MNFHYVNPRYNERTLLEFSIYYKFFKVTSAVPEEQIMPALKEVPLTTKTISFPEGLVITKVITKVH